MPLKLYMTKLSPPVRAVLMTARALGLEMEMKEVNLMAGEQLTPEYLKMNPQHTVPTLIDGDYSIWDSHAISSYLVSKYAPDDSLYPRDLQKRALVDQRLHFDSGILFPRARGTFFPILFLGETKIPDHRINDILEAYDFMEKFLECGKWLTGDSLTIADFCSITTVSSLEIVVPIDEAKYPKLIAWRKQCEQLPYYQETNQVGLDALTKIFKTKITLYEAKI